MGLDEPGSEDGPLWRDTLIAIIVGPIVVALATILAVVVLTIVEALLS